MLIINNLCLNHFRNEVLLLRISFPLQGSCVPSSGSKTTTRP
jgi:hypothetical protein